MSCKKGLACLGIICAVQMLPQTVLADDSAAQVNPKDSTAQTELTGSAGQVDPAGAAAQIELTGSAGQVDPAGAVSQIELTEAAGQIDPADDAAPNNTADSAEISESLFENLKEETPEGVPANDAASPEGENTQDSVSEAPGNDADIDAEASDDPGSDECEGTQGGVTKVPGSDADTDVAASNDPASPEIGGAQDSVRKAGGNDVGVNAAAPDNAAGDDQITDDADTEETNAPIPALVSAEDSPTAAGAFPSRFDLRDLGRVTPVKLQSPWGTCWAFGATAAAESSILTKMDSTYAETGLDLSERYLAWYVAQPVTENISTSQAGEGLHLYDENPNNIYAFGGKEKCAGTLYAQGIGPVPESDYPYRGLEGNLAYEALLANKDAFIEAYVAAYKQTNPFESEDTMRRWAERDYEYDLSRYAVYDTYSQLDDWTISEADEPGSGRLRGAPYTLTDNNVFVYWVLSHHSGIDTFGKEPVAELPLDELTTRLLYQDSIDQIKAELLAGRGVSVDIRIGKDTLNKETWAQNYDGAMTVAPHGVCIVGWDDDYAASNFSTLPPENGAWIVKNSYGSQTDMIPGGLVAGDGTTRDANGGDWGIVDENGLHTGYFYLSYFDEGIGIPESFDFDLRENHDQENALQLDFMPAATDEWIHKSEIPLWSANVFTLEKDMRIDEVATRFAMDKEVPLTGFTVTFDIYRLNDGASAPDEGELLATCTREFKNFGNHRVALDAPVYSKAGDRLAVVVQQRHNYEDGRAKYVVSSLVSLEYKSNPLFRRDPLYGTSVVNEGESFLKIEGVTEKEETATEGWLDVCAPFSKDFLWYLNPDIANNPFLASYYESIAVGNPIYDFYGFENFGIKAFGEPVTLEYVEPVTATCEEAGSLAYWRDPLSGAIFEDGSGMKRLTWEDVTLSPLGHDWGEPVYIWSVDNSRVTAKSICRRATDHVLEESVDTTSDCDARAGKITWTAQFENGIFTTQTRSADTEPVCDDTDGGNESRQTMAGNPGVRTSTVKKTSASPAAKTSDTTVIHPAPVPTGDDSEPALWYTLFAQALTCIAAVFTLHRRRRRVPGSLTDRADSDCRR